MLEVINVHKSYTTGDFTQVALDDVSLTFRSNEFVAILGPSGSGKTTLLNIVGGLDAYDDGDLTIDGVSTTAFSDRDWDTYRNNRVGFVFQNYNLIPHQSVLANVELALTLSGVSRSERRHRAMDALAQVGLAEHAHKRPNQLSGGQMQRVTIARALINDPEILLADEPTGALDSTTSTQIMALLTQIAADRLVIMVTHNADLAARHATRTITLTDGAVVSDTDPYASDSVDLQPSQAPARRTRMSSLAALGLSLANLLTKRGRTFMTAFAGSIGIIGIAAILALANGVNDYIRTVEEDTLSVYPLTIQSQGLDMAMFLTASTELAEQATTPHDDDGRVHEVQVLNRMLSSVGANDLGSLKEFLDGGPIDDDVSSVHYSYDVDPHIYSANDDGSYDQVNPASSGAPAARAMGPSMQPQEFSELMANTEVVESQYDVVAGRWPRGHDELLVVLTPSGDISDFTLYAMGLRDRAERDEMLRQMAEGDAPTTAPDPMSFTPAELLDVTFELAHASDYYVFDDDYEVWVDKHGEGDLLEQLLGHSTLEIVGVVQPKDAASATALQPGIHYTPSLTQHVMNYAAGSTIVANQQSDRAIDVFTGRPFDEEGTSLAREDFDIQSLLTIDEDAVADAFSIDESALDLSSLGLTAPSVEFPDLHLPELAIDPADLPPLDFDGLLDGIDLDVSDDDAVTAVEGFVGGYLEFVAAEALDPVEFEENLPLFLETEEAGELLEEWEELAQGPQKQLEERIEQELSGYLQTAITGVMNNATAQIGASLQQQIASAMQSQMASGGCINVDGQSLMGKDLVTWDHHRGESLVPSSRLRRCSWLCSLTGPSSKLPTSWGLIQERLVIG